MPLNVTLASSLLDLELERDRKAAEAGGRTFTTNITALDKGLPADLWHGGNVIGVGSSSSSRSLTLEVIATHLIEQAGRHIEHASSKQEGIKPSVFIITPADQATSLIHQVYQVLVARISQLQERPPDARLAPSEQTLLPDAKSLLNGVSLLQYLDISGLSESLSEVFTAVTSQFVESSWKTIVVVQGLTTCVNATQRRSGILQTTTLLSSVLQSMRNVVRSSGGMCVGLLEVDIAWTSMNFNSIGRHTTVTVGNPSPTASDQDQVVRGLDTAFSSKTGKILKISTSATLSRIVEEGVDVLVAVHDADGRIDARNETRRIVEVVRDERADHTGEESALGLWAVWS